MKIKKKILTSNKFPIFRHKTTIRGKNIVRDIVHRPDVAAIIAYYDKKIIVVRQNRFPNGVDIEIPSGNIEDNETPIESAHREFIEETGYTAKKMTPFFTFFTSIGYSTQRIHCFIASDFQKTSKPNLDPGELLKMEVMSFNKLMKMIMSGKIIDSITLSSVLSFAIKKKLI
jgi:ADP-ribose pyrophosphatase